MAVFGEELARAVGDRHGSPVEMMHLNRGIMVSFDPDSARPNPEVLKAIVRVGDNKAGVYGTVIRRGRVAVGQPVFFEPAAEERGRP